MKINKKSWHYQLINDLVVTWEHEIARDICGYVKQVIKGLSFITLLCIFALSLVTCLPALIYLSFFLDIYNLVLVLTLSCGWIIVGIWVMLLCREELPHDSILRKELFTAKTYTDGYKEQNLIELWLRSKKAKVCTRLEFTND